MKVVHKDNVATRVGYIIISLCFLYGGLFCIFFKSVIGLYPVIASIICLLGNYFIYKKLSALGRFLIAVGPISLNAVFHASMVEDGDPLIRSLYISEFGMLLITWLVFDLRDKKALFFSALIGFGIVCFQNEINSMIPALIDGSLVFVDTWLDVTTYFASILLITISLYFFQKELYNSETKNSSLVTELKRYHKRLINDNQNLYAEQMEMTMLNNILEQKVHERTEKLISQNKLLAEHSYINSHLLRAPLCRLEGLMNLMKDNPDGNMNEELFMHMQQSIDEMNELTIRISMILEKNGLYQKYKLNFEKLQSVIRDSGKLGPSHDVRASA